MNKTARPRNPALVRYVLVGLVVPIVVVLVGVALLVAAMPALPDPVGIHWNAAGQVDGFGAVWLPAVLLAAVGLGLPILFAVASIPAIRGGDFGYAFRFLGAMNLGTSVFLTVLITWSTLAQRGLEDARDAPSVGIALLVSLLAAAVLGVAGWLLQPDQPFRPGVADAVEPLALAGDERAVWLQRASFSRGPLLVLSGAVILLIVLTVANIFLRAPGWSNVVLIASTLLVGFGVAASAAFHVRVDHTGLSITSVLGFPRLSVPAAQITAVEAVEVSPVGEFGGWGWRFVPGRIGIVLRRGEGMTVHRVGRRAITITVDDAATGAALLETYARRAMGSTPGTR